ncbi:MAG: hypothetical protein QW103_02915 [Candidatus Pacearchaeota archaeon]
MVYTITDILNKMNEFGVFSYILPFLLVFAIVFGLLQKTKIFGDENKSRGINAIIALAVAGLSLLFDFVPIFFSNIFPKFGIGLAVFLVLIIVLGFFFNPNDDNKKGPLIWIGWFVALGVVIWALTEWSDMGGFGNFKTGWFLEYLPLILTIGLLFAAIYFIVGGGGSSGKSP